VAENLLVQLTRRCGDEFVIALEDAFGNHEWLWFPGIPQGEIEAWWTALEDVETFWHQKGRASWPGEFVRMDGDIEHSRLWERLWNGDAYRICIDLNEQSDLGRPETYLRTPSGKRLLHKGAFKAAASSPFSDPGPTSP
jgi:hypothetical protein